MTDQIPPAGTRFDYPPDSPFARCGLCRQPRTPLFQTTPDTHLLLDHAPDDPPRACLRCWSSHHLPDPPASEPPVGAVPLW